MNTLPTQDPLAVPSADPAAAAPLVATIRDRMRRHRVPSLTIAVVRHDRLLYADGFGDADLAAGLRATPRTAYLWFSMSKIATATAAVALAEAGRLDLDAPITRYLPDYPAPRSGSRPVVGQLLDHTAGLGNPAPVRWVHRADAPVPDPAAFLQRRLRRGVCARHPVGGPAHYSNLGYLVLGEVLAAAAGEPFTDAVTRTVLRPARMHHTGYEMPSDRPTATGYVRVSRVVAPALRVLLPSGIVGPRHGHLQSLRPFLVDGAAYGGLVGDVTDAARLAALHLADGSVAGHQVITQAAARRMRTIRTPGRHRDLAQGWFRPVAARDARPSYVEHLGSGGGFNNVMRLYPDLDLGVVVMTNATGAPDHDAICAAAAAVPWP